VVPELIEGKAFVPFLLWQRLESGGELWHHPVLFNGDDSHPGAGPFARFFTVDR
jgi:hypothetical protein